MLIHDISISRALILATWHVWLARPSVFGCSGLVSLCAHDSAIALDGSNLFHRSS